MTAQLIDGKQIAQQLRDEVAAKVAARTAAGKQKPTLATVLVGDRPDSAAYVASKGKACQELGMGSISEHLPADATQEQVETLVKRLNADPGVSGILVQLPMPSHIDEEHVLSLINIEKDVDGFSPLNIGRLAQKGREPLFVPCTPYGCIYLLEKSGVKIEGANAVVLAWHRDHSWLSHRFQMDAATELYFFLDRSMGQSRPDDLARAGCWLPLLGDGDPHDPLGGSRGAARRLRAHGASQGLAGACRGDQARAA